MQCNGSPYWVNPSKIGGTDGAWPGRPSRAAPRDFLRVKPEKNPEEKPCQPKENLVIPNSFTLIYILFQIGIFNVPK